MQIKNAILKIKRLIIKIRVINTFAAGVKNINWRPRSLSALTTRKILIKEIPGISVLKAC